MYVTLKGQVQVSHSSNAVTDDLEFIDGKSRLTLIPANGAETFRVPAAITITAEGVTTTLNLEPAEDSKALLHRIESASLGNETLEVEANDDDRCFSVNVGDVYTGESVDGITFSFDEPLINDETSIEIRRTHNVETGYDQPYARFDQGRLLVSLKPVSTSDDSFSADIRLHFNDNSYLDIALIGNVITGVAVKYKGKFYKALDYDSFYQLNNVPARAGWNEYEIYGNDDDLDFDDFSIGDPNFNVSSLSGRILEVSVNNVSSFNDSDDRYIQVGWSDTYLQLNFSEIPEGTYTEAAGDDGNNYDLNVEFDEEQNAATVYLNDNEVHDLDYMAMYNLDAYNGGLRYIEQGNGIYIDEVTVDDGVHWTGEPNGNFDPSQATGPGNWYYNTIPAGAEATVSQSNGWHASIKVKP